MRYDIVTIGDALEDVFVEPDLDIKSDARFASGKGICFEFGEKIPLNSVTYEIGGSACNTAVGFSRLGYKSAIVTTLGDDTPKDKVLERLENEGVELSQIKVNREVETGFSVIFNISGERTIFVYHGLKDYNSVEIKKSLKSRWYYIAPLGKNTDEIENKVIEKLAVDGSQIAWNPSGTQIEKGANHYKHLLKCASVLFLNRTEAMKFLNRPVRPQVDELMKDLHNFGPKIVVITEGKKGAKAYDGEIFYDIEANPRVQVIDATGAGDSFAVGFLGRLLNENWREKIEPNIIKDALRWGIKNSGSVIQYIGAQKGLLNKEEI